MPSSCSTRTSLAQSCLSPSPGFNAWWPFDETSGTIANDIVGNNPGAYVNSPVPIPGEVAYALSFNGTNYVEVADSSLWALGNENFTIEFWVNFATEPGGSMTEPADIFIANDEGPYNVNKWFFAIGGGNLEFHINSPTLGPQFFPLVPFSPTINQWYHLALTRQSNTYTIYINGIPSGSAVNTNTIPTPNAPLTIATAEGIGFVDGDLDEMTMYNQALSASQILSIVDAGHAGKCKNLAITTTALTSSPNPSTYGQTVTFTATVSSSAGAPPNGEIVTFNSGSAVLGAAPLSLGAASFPTSSLQTGIYTITATYGGDANFAASTSPSLRQVVNSTTKSATSTALASSLNPSIYGQSITWTATVTTSGSISPTGTVNFKYTALGITYSLGVGQLNPGGVATLTRSNLNADLYPITASYSGDQNNLASTSPVLNQVITQATTTAMLTSSPNPSTQGETVTFTATITSPTVTPTGPVTFTAGKTTLGTGQLSKGKATFTTSTLAVGSTTVTATYNGDSNIAESSASVTQTVQR